MNSSSGVADDAPGRETAKRGERQPNGRRSPEDRCQEMPLTGFMLYDGVPRRAHERG
jgi:hypothetical protein